MFEFNVKSTLILGILLIAQVYSASPIIDSLKWSDADIDRVSLFINRPDIKCRFPAKLLKRVESALLKIAYADPMGYAISSSCDVLGERMYGADVSNMLNLLTLMEADLTGVISKKCNLFELCFGKFSDEASTTKGNPTDVKLPHKNISSEKKELDLVFSTYPSELAIRFGLDKSRFDPIKDKFILKFMLVVMQFEEEKGELIEYDLSDLSYNDAVAVLNFIDRVDAWDMFSPKIRKQFEFDLFAMERSAINHHTPSLNGKFTAGIVVICSILFRTEPYLMSIDESLLKDIYDIAFRFYGKYYFDLEAACNENMDAGELLIFLVESWTRDMLLDGLLSWILSDYIVLDDTPGCKRSFHHLMRNKKAFAYLEKLFTEAFYKAEKSPSRARMMTVKKLAMIENKLRSLKDYSEEGKRLLHGIVPSPNSPALSAPQIIDTLNKLSAFIDVLPAKQIVDAIRPLSFLDITSNMVERLEFLNPNTTCFEIAFELIKDCLCTGNVTGFRVAYEMIVNLFYIYSEGKANRIFGYYLSKWDDVVDESTNVNFMIKDESFLSLVFREARVGNDNLIPKLLCRLLQHYRMNSRVNIVGEFLDKMSSTPSGLLKLAKLTIMNHVMTHQLVSMDYRTVQGIMKMALDMIRHNQKRSFKGRLREACQNYRLYTSDVHDEETLELKIVLKAPQDRITSESVITLKVPKTRTRAIDAYHFALLQIPKYRPNHHPFALFDETGNLIVPDRRLLAEQCASDSITLIVFPDYEYERVCGLGEYIHDPPCAFMELDLGGLLKGTMVKIKLKNFYFGTPQDNLSSLPTNRLYSGVREFMRESNQNCNVDSLESESDDSSNEEDDASSDSEDGVEEDDDGSNGSSVDGEEYGSEDQDNDNTRGSRSSDSKESGMV